MQILWTLQDTSGANAGSWPWIQFNNEPWEAYDSRDYGAILAGLAIGMAPDDYRSDPAIQPALDRLRSYLDRAYPEQAPVRRVAMLWLSTRLPGVLSPDRRRTIIDEIWSLQRPDGGWCLAALGGPWKRRDGTTQAMQSDGYATGLAVLALQQSGISADDPRLHHGLAWLAGNQDQDGYWSGFSLNKRRIRLDDAARFMDDAATAYAVLALTQKRPAPTVAGQR
ncbi:MAG: hypothetical protein ACREUT_08210 [Steroidobacteraceae bacterium]